MVKTDFLYFYCIKTTNKYVKWTIRLCCSSQVQQILSSKTMFGFEWYCQSYNSESYPENAELQTGS